MWRLCAMCRILRASKSGCFEWRDGLESPRRSADRALTTRIATIHHEPGEVYGGPRIHRVLREQGTRVGHKRVERLMHSRDLGVAAPSLRGDDRLSLRSSDRSKPLGAGFHRDDAESEMGDRHHLHPD